MAGKWAATYHFSFEKNKRDRPRIEDIVDELSVFFCELMVHALLVLDS